MKRSMLTPLAFVVAFGSAMTSCQKPKGQVQKQLAAASADTVYRDTAFWQLTHDAHPVVKGKETLPVRAVCVANDGAVWISTAAGIFVKHPNSREWKDGIPTTEQGPSFAIVKAADGALWMSNWNKVYRLSEGRLQAIEGMTSPVGSLAPANEGVYALGPKGAWLIKGEPPTPLSYTVARSVRASMSDGKGGLWVGSDVGIYHGEGDSVMHTNDTTDLISAYVRGIATDSDGNIWFGGLGGVSIRTSSGKTIKMRPANGLPSIQVNCVEQAPDGSMWIGTDVGVVRYTGFKKHSLLFSRRWLLNDRVTDISFAKDGTAWIATDGGVSAIHRKRMTLASKETYFYDVLMRRHIREPWIAGQCKLPIAGDTTRWEGDDDDNDGEYTSNYLAMESFRFAATKDEDAKAKAKKAFEFLKKLQEVTETDGFFARTIVPASWTAIDDGNRTYTARELADELVKEPRFKPVEVRWRKSKDGKWLWKGDTSSDEICGHMMGYFFYHELVADENEKKVIAAHVKRIVDHLMRNNYTLTDTDGTHTRWGVWSPDRLNHDPEWEPDRSLNSMELLAFLKLAYHVTHEDKYQNEYLRLIKEEHYLDNMSNVPRQNPGWFIYFDVILAAYQYPILLKCEKDPELLKFYEKHADDWIERRKNDANPLINFIYSYSRGKKAELSRSVDFLIDTPLDLIDWKIDHEKREDIQLVRTPILDEVQVSELPPASIRATVRWDKNPWSLNNGNPNMEREPVFWLLPYWMGRYLTMIE
ncbi:two-component regulator propeller domain-containing protein [Chryseolinea sp. T2]|uniref:ligand-binding sensor domain-containing protein n=1 Tax=Chryseolinea sp. T2 TaxID=3129255 RepID=UPI00307700CB